MYNGKSIIDVSLHIFNLGNYNGKDIDCIQKFSVYAFNKYNNVELDLKWSVRYYIQN